MNTKLQTAIEEAVIPLPYFNPDDLGQDRQFLIELYDQQPYFLERLPYTKIFEALVECFNDQATTIRLTPFLAFQYLNALRKSGELAGKTP